MRFGTPVNTHFTYTRGVLYCLYNLGQFIELEADFICLIKLFVPFYYYLFAGLDRLIAEPAALVQTQNSGLSVLQAPALPMVLA